MHELDPMDQRILGALLEKQRTVPASYPMSLNAVRTACNQTSSRDPVVDYDEKELQTRLKSLKDRGLIRVVWADRGPRTLKYHQLLDEQLSLCEDHRALLTVLLLRGPQAPGELKTRTERLHAFADRGAVEEALREMALHQTAESETPLVRELERRPGQQDARWAHRLGPIPEGAEPGAVTGTGSGPDREGELADGAAARNDKVVAAYDAVAGVYADQLSDELARKSFDRWLLDRVAALAQNGARDAHIVDVGTGPGQVAGYLAAGAPGATVRGQDLSPAMVEQARRRWPEVEFEVGDLAGLMRPRTADGWSAITAWYSLVHLAGSELAPTIAGLARVLRGGGWLALALHTGTEIHHVEEWWEQSVDVDFVLHDPAQVLDAIRAAGLTDIEWYHRGPLAGEVETDRLYVLARRPLPT